MSIPISAPVSLTAVEEHLLENLDFNVTCDYKDCEGIATHKLVCPCVQFEYMCNPHTLDAKGAPKGSWIIFDQSCSHRVDIFDCGKEPI
jgi:hypothetical protein